MRISTGIRVDRFIWATAVFLLALTPTLVLTEDADAKKPTIKTPRSITPKPKSILHSSRAKFKWTNVGARRYDLYIGSRRGRSDIYGQKNLKKRSTKVLSLPTDGRKLYVRIVARFGIKHRCRKRGRKSRCQRLICRRYRKRASGKSRTRCRPLRCKKKRTSRSRKQRCKGRRTRSFTLIAHRKQGTGVPPGADGPATNPPATKTTPDPGGQTPPKTEVSSSLTAAWANDGGDKITQDELRATSDPNSVHNSVWDGSKIKVFGASNEVVAFNLVLEAAQGASDVSLSLNKLTGPNGTEIQSAPAAGNELFDWTDRDIELFYVRYLQIKGLSRLTYQSYYDERHVPVALRRPFTGQGEGSGDWFDRPNADKFYPDIAVPIELESNFDIDQGKNQSIWADIYIPKGSPPGKYLGTVTVKEKGSVTHQMPVELEVLDFQLPDTPSAKTMTFLSSANINRRYLDEEYPADGSPQDQSSKQIQDRHFKLAHRHRISLIESDNESGNGPDDIWIPRLDGTLFTSANGYRGPGENVGNNIYSIGTYSSWWWSWDDDSNGQISEQEMRDHSDAWVNWFNENAPDADHFLYLIDESSDYAQIEQWAQWLDDNPGPGNQLDSMSTVWLTDAQANTPSLDIAGTGFSVGITDLWNDAIVQKNADPTKKHFMYNGHRPTHGTFALEDDGVALRVTPWGQFKKGVDRWFKWESTYYNNFQSIVDSETDEKTCDHRDLNDGGNTIRCQTNVFKTAKTFGVYQNDCFADVGCGGYPYGQTGWNYTNGDGVLFYPGTDTVFPDDSYGIDGPLASLRLKHWRRGIQDVDYLTMAKQIDPQQVDQIVASTVPKVFWEYGVDNEEDPTYVHTDISWSTDPDDWEAARKQLAEIIEGE